MASPSLARGLSSESRCKVSPGSMRLSRNRFPDSTRNGAENGRARLMISLSSMPASLARMSVVMSADCAGSPGSPGPVRRALRRRSDLPGRRAAVDRAADHFVEDRREEQAEGRASQQAAERRDAERESHLAAGPGRRHEGDDAEDEGERRHDDRSEPDPAGLD